VRPALPAPRGPVSGALLEILQGAPGLESTLARLRLDDADALVDEDRQLSLYVCYELSYRGLHGVDDSWEWDLGLLGLRRRLEADFESALRRAVPPADPSDDPRAELMALAGRVGGPSLSMFMAEQGTLDQLRQLAIHRSAYQLKEADPHTWMIPRLAGRAKAAMVRIQADEYGGGRAEAMHSALFADTMVALGLDPTYGAHVDLIPAVTLATVNLISLLGLHRRLRGALVGHLALFEMTSVGPMSLYSRAMNRLGVDSEGRRFYDVHVTADVEHRCLALDQMVAGLVEAEPGLAPDIVDGARWLCELERRFSDHILGAWSRNCSSLLAPEQLRVAA
jgi:hypothetical protein